MVSVEKRDKGVALILTDKELLETALNTDKEYDIVNAQQGAWLLWEKEAGKKDSKQVELEEKIIGLIKSKKLSEKVEGKFEEELSKEELPVFKQMLEEGKIIAFKLSEKYKKAVYKLAPEKKKESENFGAPKKNIEDYSLEKDGLMVIKNENRAKKIAYEQKDNIKGGKLKGIKSFDGYSYLIEEALYQRHREHILASMQASKKTTLEALCKSINISKTLGRIAIEFLKEEGELIEKKKEDYEYIAE